MSHAFRPGFYRELFSHFVRNAPHEFHGDSGLSPAHRPRSYKGGLLHQLVARHPVDEYRVRKEAVDRTGTVPPTHTFK